MTELISSVFVCTSTIAIALSATACNLAESPHEPAEVAAAQSALSADQRLADCNQDPRVVTGLASAQICAGADLFFRETFQGNGRTCGSCHPVENNFTLDEAFIAGLPSNDPLFVFESDPNLVELETPSLRSMAGILENVDDLDEFVDPTHKFVVRSVPHVLSLATSITTDDSDPLTTTPPEQRTGWGGDGGSLRDFLNTAIKQHYPKRLARVEDVDFRLATPQELALVETFQRNLGRLNELDFSQITLFDALAQEGKIAYIDPMRGRCQICHLNGGANFETTGQNRNFDSGTRLALRSDITIPFFDGVFLFDGGFGGKGLEHPNTDSNPGGPNNGFGNNSFSTPPAIEAVDTLPAFHTNTFGADNGPGTDNDNIENVLTFYAGVFNLSQAAADLNVQFGGPANVAPDIPSIGRFLRALNVALNLDMTKQRLRAAQTILNRFRDQHLAIQRRLIELAVAELDDALEVLRDPVTPQPFYPIAVNRLDQAKAAIAAALASPTWMQRRGPLSTAISRVENARDQIGSNITFSLGAGDLFF